MKTRYAALAGFVAVALLTPVCDVEACGPDFDPDVFVSTTSPDDLGAFARGQLGILQAGFDSNEYAVAYRYLNGGKLSDSERQAYAPPSGPPKIAQDTRKLTPEQIAAAQAAEQQARKNAQPAGKWLLARAGYVQSAAPAAIADVAFPTDYEGNIVFDESYLNCPDPAFANATLTLTKRADTWGRQSKWLTDWIHAQDAVFSNCAGKNASTPAPAAIESPALLKADRAYQIASATFYAKQFDEAARQFAAIGADRSSPWSAWGQYLAARATVRKAFAMGKSTDPYSGDLASFDMDTMRRAQQMLEALLSQPNPTPSRSVIQDELNFIRIRTEPAKRATEISAALTGPEPDVNFAHDMQDLGWLLTKHVEVDNPAPLLAWIAAWRGSGTSAQAFATWQQSHALPWLVMAMVKSGASDEFAPTLIDEAAKIAPGTPAYETVFYHRVRLLTGLKRTDEARALLDAALPALRKQKPTSNLNALLGERIAVARTFSEFLEFAPRSTLRTGSQGAWDLQGQCNERAHAVNSEAACPEAKLPVEFDEDAVRILNRRIPIRLLIQAASTPSLPENLRQDLAVVAWTRSVLLEDAQGATELAPLLPNAIRDAAGSNVGFPADLTILRNPGIRPYLESGVSRVASYSYFDELRDNWWCKPWDYREESGLPKPQPLPAPAFISPDQLALADGEYQRLQQLPDSAAIIGQRVVDYAKDHAEDPQGGIL